MIFLSRRQMQIGCALSVVVSVSLISMNGGNRETKWNELWGHVSNAGKMVIDSLFREAESLSEGVAQVDLFPNELEAVELRDHINRVFVIAAVFLGLGYVIYQILTRWKWFNGLHTIFKLVALYLIAVVGLCLLILT